MFSVRIGVFHLFRAWAGNDFSDKPPLNNEFSEPVTIFNFDNGEMPPELLFSAVKIRSRLIIVFVLL